MHLKSRTCEPHTPRIRRQTASLVFQVSGNYLVGLYEHPTGFRGQVLVRESLFIVILGLTSVMLYGRTLSSIDSRLIEIDVFVAYFLCRR